VIYGGLAFTIYGLSVAHVNDLLPPSKVLEVTSGLLLLHGIGATVGPTIAGAVMDALGPESLMLYFAIVLGLLSASVWWFVTRKSTPLSPNSHKTDYVVMGGGSQAVLKMDPRNTEAQPPNAPRPERPN
jgi:MFS family permease